MDARQAGSRCTAAQLRKATASASQPEGELLEIARIPDVDGGLVRSCCLEKDAVLAGCREDIQFVSRVGQSDADVAAKWIETKRIRSATIISTLFDLHPSFVRIIGINADRDFIGGTAPKRKYSRIGTESRSC